MDLIRKFRISPVLALALGMGFFLHYKNLQGTIYLNEDEARAFTLLSSGPMIRATGKPGYLAFGHTHTSDCLMLAPLGFLCISVFY